MQRHRQPKIRRVSRVQLLHTKGPANGANVYFPFDLNPRINGPPYSPSKNPTDSRFKPAGKSNTAQELEFRDALVLVSCVKSKLPNAAPAKSLYTSAWFSKTRS